MKEPSTKAYGQGRTHPAVSYREIERAAIVLLKSERRPTVENIRVALGHGSPATIGEALKRFWRDLGVRIEGDPAALSRMPSEIADLADGMWQTALKLAGDAATQDDNGARERLQHLQTENEVRAMSFEVREREYDAAARSREQALADSHKHLLLVMKSVGREQAIKRAQDSRIADLNLQVQHYRQQIASLILKAVSSRRAREGNTARAPKPRTAKRSTAPSRSHIKRPLPPRSSRLPRKNRTTSRKDRIRR